LSEALIKLTSQADTIDLRKVGLVSVTKPKYISGRQMASYCRTAAAQAIIDNISNTQSDLVIRNAIPRLDFLDGYGADIHDKTWIQPQNNVEYDQSNHTEYPIYLTNRNVDNDRKILFVYGILNMKPDKPVYATRLYFKTDGVRVHDIIDLTTLQHYNNIIFLQIPMLYRRSSNAAISVDLGPDARGHNDHLALLAIVAEHLGVHMNG
jgi:hypothetical protein